MDTPKNIIWMGNSKADLSSFPKSVKTVAGTQLMRLQHGLLPENSRTMGSIGRGVFEIKIQLSEGAYRVVYAMVVKGSVVVLHCFQKKSRRTSTSDLDIVIDRLKHVKRIK